MSTRHTTEQHLTLLHALGRHVAPRRPKITTHTNSTSLTRGDARNAGEEATRGGWTDAATSFSRVSRRSEQLPRGRNLCSTSLQQRHYRPRMAGKYFMPLVCLCCAWRVRLVPCSVRWIRSKRPARVIRNTIIIIIMIIIIFSPQSG